MRLDDPPELLGCRLSGKTRPLEGFGHEVQRAVLAEVEDLALALEVMVQVPRGEVRLLRDLAHARPREPPPPERPRGGAENLELPRIGPALAPHGSGAPLTSPNRPRLVP